MLKLDSRVYYHRALKIHETIGTVKSPGDIEDWDYYWSEGMANLWKIGNTLFTKDTEKSLLLKSIIEDFQRSPHFTKNWIYSKFINREHLWAQQSRHPKVQIKELYFDNGAIIKDLYYEDGEEALRLYEIALESWHEHLCIIEVAIKENLSSPFSLCEPHFNNLRQRCNYPANAPNCFRL